MRISQVIAIGVDNEDYELTSSKASKLLKSASKTLRHALVFEEVEAETKTEGKLLLACASLLQGEIEDAQKLATQTLEEARQFELTWLIALAQSVMGRILVAQFASEQAVSYFEQALRTFRKTEMRLEYARTLHLYGEMLVQQEKGGNGKMYQRGLGYLHEAREIFAKCKAGLDVRVVEGVLARYEQVSKV
jgi:tetratricopeptide (TPR) repeat protein